MYNFLGCQGTGNRNICLSIYTEGQPEDRGRVILSQEVTKKLTHKHRGSVTEDPTVQGEEVSPLLDAEDI